MSTIKSFTSLEQSRKLAEILPIESADMYYLAKPDDTNSNMVVYDICFPRKSENDGQAFGEVCAWSLAALLGVLPKGYSIGRRTNGKYYVCMTHIKHNISEFDNPVDACYEMILKLQELKML